MDLVHTEQLDPNASTHNVHDGIHRADLMEVNLLQRNPVNLCFRFTDTTEHAQRAVLHAL